MIIRRLLLVLNFLIGIGGMAGGTLALLPEVQAAAGINDTLLVNSPFATFLIPGLFLFTVIGLGNLATSWINLRKQAEGPYYQCLMGLIQCFWIITQCLMLLTVNPLHLIFLFLGSVQLIGGIILVRQTKAVFPFSAHQN